MVPPLGARNDGAQPSVGAPRHKPSPSKSAAVPTHTPAAPRLGDVVGLAGDSTQPEGHGDLRLRMDTPLPQASPPAKPLPSMAVAVLTGGDSTPRGLAEDASAPTTATTSAASSGLNSPLAAFAAARARLARSTRDADRLLHSTLAALDSLHPQAAAACANSAPGTAAWPDDASERGSSPGTSRVSTPRHPALAQVPNCGAAPSSSAVSAVAALHQRNLRLKERMSTTMALCHALHEQNRESMEKVAQLCSSKQRLSKSLQDAQLDKEGLQSTIRQLTVEAALLAEQARRALLPSAAPSPRSVPECLELPAPHQEEPLPAVHGGPEAGRQREGQRQAQREQHAWPQQADRPAGQQEEAGQPQQAEVKVQAEEQQGHQAVPHRQGAEAAQSADDGEAEQEEENGQAAQQSSTTAAAGMPTECDLQESQQPHAMADTSVPGVSAVAAATAAYVQAGGGCGDKRRRVAPALLVEVALSPAAEDPEAEPTAVAAAPASRTEAQDAARAEQQADVAELACSQAVVAQPVAEVAAGAAVPSVAVQVVKEQEWETFRLFDRKWFGGSGC